MQKNANCSRFTGAKALCYLLVHKRTQFRLPAQMLRIMRMLSYLLLAGFLNVHASGSAQTVTFTGNDVSLKTILAAVKKQTGYYVFADADILKMAKPVSISASDMPLTDFLDLALRDQSFNYRIDNKTISLMQKERKAVFLQIAAQPVTGRVTDSSGSPLKGASVKIKGTVRGTATNDNGEFTIEVNEGDVLTISFVGYQSRNWVVSPAAIASGSVPGIVLAPSLSTLAGVDVSVNTGYQRLSKNELIGAYSFVNEDMLNKRITTDIISRLEGQVAGLVFNKNSFSSRLGYMDINIQGRNTLYADDQPLIVVDNFVYEGDYKNINPNDVASVTVLKDASAAAIWGVRSGNGVIVITTKKGSRNQRMSVDANANITITDKPNLFYNPAFLNIPDYIELDRQLFDSGYYQINDPLVKLSPLIQILADQRMGKITQAQANSMIETLKTQDMRKDRSQYLYRRAVRQQYSLGVRGGSEYNDYSVSFGFDNNLAALAGNKDQRATLNTLLNFYLSQKLTFTLGINTVYSQEKNNADGITLPSEPYNRLADDNGNPLDVAYGGWDYSDRYKDSLANLGYMNWKYSPLKELAWADRSAAGFDSRINLGLNYKILRTLQLNIGYQYQRYISNTRNYASDSTYEAREIINQFTQLRPDGSFFYPIPVGGILTTSEQIQSSHQLRAQMNYEQRWNEHWLKAMLSVEIRSAVTRSTNNILYGYNEITEFSAPTIDFATYYPTLPYGGGRQIPNNQGSYRMNDNYLSHLGDIIYSYKNLYGFSASGRIDYSNMFGVKTNQKAVPLYSLGVSYTISNAKYYKIRWMPYSKIRLSYGYNGNINKNASAVTTAVQSSSGDRITGLPYADIRNPGNPELRWEKVQKINIGYDFATRNDILSGQINIYFKKGIDLFGNTAVAPSTGFTAFFGNYASTKGSGFDLDLTSFNIRKKDFQWSTRLTLNHVVDKVVKSKLDQYASAFSVIQQAGGTVGGIVPIEGKPLFGVYAFRSGGLTHDTGDPQGYFDGKLSTDYNQILQKTTIDSLYFFGHSRPTTTGYLWNHLSFKGLTLSFSFAYNFNYYYRRLSMSNGFGKHSDYTKRWQQPGDEAFTTVPYIQPYPHINYSRTNFYDHSSAVVDRGDHIRLQDINLTYIIDKKNLRMLPFNSISIYAAATNLGVIWRANQNGIDPETDATSIGSFPQPKAYTIGARISL